MTILIAPDKFKGSLSARAVGTAIATGIQQVLPSAHLIVHPLADGGDGSLDVLRQHLNLQTVKAPTLDPLGRPMEATYLMGANTAFIELASASGLVLLTPTERNPLHTSTYGSGLLIRDALARGASHFTLLLGGSATNDLGLGIAHALGFTFFDRNDQPLRPTGLLLGDISRYVPPAQPMWEGAHFTLLCDVDNPLYGPRGAAYVYAPQKGASYEQVAFLDAGLQSSSSLIEQLSGKNISQLPGGGAAGGVAAGLVGLFDAELRSGFSAISEITGLEAAIQSADLVISGEGKLDGQSLSGKVVGGISQLCRRHQKTLWLAVGQNELSPKQWETAGIQAVQSVLTKATTIEDAMQEAASYLQLIGRDWGGEILDDGF